MFPVQKMELSAKVFVNDDLRAKLIGVASTSSTHSPDPSRTFIGGFQVKKRHIQQKQNHATQIENAGSSCKQTVYDELPEATMSREEAYDLLHQELSHDIVPRFNLATFVSTYMDPEVTQLMAENLPKNFVDPRAYPSVSQIEKRCIQILAKLYHCPAVENKLPAGVSTVGSSEAIMLAVLAMKVQWANRQHACGNHSKPNIIMSSAAHVCWKKAALYFEVDVQYVQCSESRYVLDPVRAVDLVNDRTIGICCILGTTYTGEYEDVKAVNDLLIEGGHDVPIHVDAASGGFVAPFVAPDLQWDFRLEKVASINVSGHKYGLVYPGIGWALWRSPEKLPASLVFYLSYLGASQSSFTLNFSKSSSHVIAQYHQFVRLGKAGYRSFIHGIMKEASCLEKSLKDMGLWILSKPAGIQGIPVVAFRVGHALGFKFDEFELSAELERRGWLVPAYYMADGASHVALLRIVCRVDFTCQLREQLLRDIKLSLETLQRQKQ